MVLLSVYPHNEAGLARRRQIIRSDNLNIGLVFIITHETAPEPMLLPDSVNHWIYWHTFGLWQQEPGEQSHDDNPGSEEEEDSSLHVA